MKLLVKFKKVNPDAQIPVYKSEEAAAFDLYSVEEKTIKINETALISTGISVELPRGYCLQLWDRSGLGVKGIHKFAGLIDSDYRGELKAVLHNSSSAEYKVEKGDRIIQAAIVPVFQAEFKEAKELSDTKRGVGGFHSTGKK